MPEPVAKSHCPSCGKTFRWRGDLIGKPVRCTCGKIFSMPAAPTNSAPLSTSPASAALAPPAAPAPRAAPASAPPAAPAGDDPFSIDFPTDGPPPLPAGAGAPTTHASSTSHNNASADLARGAAIAPQRCPSCNLPWKPDAKLCLNCGYNLAVGRKVRTVVDDDAGPPARPHVSRIGASHRPTPVATAALSVTTSPDQLIRRRSPIQEALQQREYDEGASPWKERYIPWAFLVIGAALPFWEMAIDDDVPADKVLAGGLIVLTSRLVLMTPVLIAAAFITARVLSVSFGTLTDASFKLAGIALGPLSLANIVMAYIVAATLGTGWMLWIVVYFFLGEIPLIVLFDLDFFESFFMLLVIVAIHFGAGLLMAMVVMAML